MKNLKTKIALSILLLSSLMFMPLQSDAGTTFSSRQLVGSPVTGEVPVFQADGSMASGSRGAGVTLDTAYDGGNEIDYTGASTSGDAVMLAATAGDNPANFMTMTMDTDQEFAFLTDGNFYAGNGTTDYVKINSNGMVLFDTSHQLMSLSATGQGGGSSFVMGNSSGLNVFVLNTEATGAVFNEIGDASLDFRIESLNNVFMFFIDASEDMIGINEGTPEYTFDIVGDLASETSIVNTSTANSGGGLQRLFSEATSGVLFGPIGIIEVDVPDGARVIGCQLRNDAAITGATAYSAAYLGGLSQTIEGVATIAKNDKFNNMYDVNAATDIAAGVVTILLTAIGSDFTGGEVHAIVYYERFKAMDDNP